MINLIRNTYKILNTKQKLRLIFVGFSSILTGLLEMISIALFIPLICLVIDENYLDKFTNLKNFLSEISDKTQIEKFYVLIILLVFIFIIKNIIILLLNYYSSKSAYLTRTEIGNKIMNNYLNANYEYFFKKKSSILFYLLTEEIARLGHMLLSLIRLFTNILITFFIFIFIFYNYPNQLMLLTATTFIGGGIYYIFTKNFVEAFGRVKVIKESNYLKNLRETLDFLKEIKIYFKENFFSSIYNHNNEIINRYGYVWSFFQTLPKIWFELVAVCSLFLILSFNYGQALDKNEIIVSLSVMIYAIARVLPSVNIIISSLQNLKFSEYGFNQIKNLISFEEKKEKIEKINLNSSNFNNLKIKDLTFSYEEKNEIIKNLNFSVKKGEIIGIIGESGSGKTTLINIVTGLLKIKSGSYLFNDNEIKNIRNEKENLFGYIPQKISLLDETIKHNIALETKNIDQKKLNKCIEKTGLTKFVNNLKLKENTIVGEKGSSLSGGQAQRIAIARALYHEPEIIILDEATNSLDAELEQNILSMLKKLQKTLIIISHHQSTLKLCDRIYKLENKSLQITK